MRLLVFGDVFQVRTTVWCFHLGVCWLCACETVGYQEGIGAGWLCEKCWGSVFVGTLSCDLELLEL